MVVLSELTITSMKFLNLVFLEAVYMSRELYLHFFFFSLIKSMYKIYNILDGRWADVWMNGWMDGQTDGRMDGRTDGRTDR